MTRPPHDTPRPPAGDDRTKVRVTLAGVDGNALSLIGAWRRAARDQGCPERDIDAVSTDALSGPYAHVLRTLCAHSEPGDDGDAE